MTIKIPLQPLKDGFKKPNDPRSSIIVTIEKKIVLNQE